MAIYEIVVKADSLELYNAFKEITNHLTLEVEFDHNPIDGEFHIKRRSSYEEHEWLRALEKVKGFDLQLVEELPFGKFEVKGVVRTIRVQADLWEIEVDGNSFQYFIKPL